MDRCPEDVELDRDIFDALAEFFSQMLELAENVAHEYAVPLFCMKALHMTETTVTMKELGKRMRCDPSFVTTIALSLEQRGLAKREPHTGDRRIKDLVLTSDGLELKDRLERALLGQMPWSRALNTKERESLLSLIRKMIGSAASTASPPTGGDGAEEVDDTLSTATAGGN